MSNKHRKVIIAGSGISGLSAGIYAGRANNEPLIFEGDEPGGQLTLTTDVENYPGFDDGVTGPELINKMKSQAEKFGATIENGIIESVERNKDTDVITVKLSNGDTYTCDSFIIASGASARTLGVPGEDELFGYGVSTCATCDGAFFRGEDMAVIGGGDAAAEEAIFLTKFADTVYVVHRRDELRSEGYLENKLFDKVDNGEVEILWNTELQEINGSVEDGIDNIKLIKHEHGHPKQKKQDGIDVEEFEKEVGAVFIAIGHTPNTDFLDKVDVITDDTGYIVTEQNPTKMKTATGVEGIFAAGDVVDSHYQQAATASGMGVMAAMDAEEYLEGKEE